MYTGWNSTGRRGARRKARTVIDSSPKRGASKRPVRERVPSTKYSIGTPRSINCVMYSLKITEYSALPLKLRQEECAALAQERAQHRQVQVHAGRDVRHHHAAHVELVRQQQVIGMAAVAGHVHHFVAR